MAQTTPKRNNPPVHRFEDYLRGLLSRLGVQAHQKHNNQTERDRWADLQIMLFDFDAVVAIVIIYI